MQCVNYLINFWIWKPANSKQSNAHAHTTRHWMFQLTVLNGSILCTDYFWNPWIFISYSNHKNTGVRTQTYGKFQFTVPQNIGFACSTWSVGDWKSLDYCCHLTHFCELFTSLYNFEIEIGMCFGDFTLQIVECYSGKHKKFSSNSLIICYRIWNVYVPLKHFLHVLR
jgi:hypothetical protein